MSERSKSLVSRIIFSTFVIYAAMTSSLLLITRSLVKSGLDRLEDQLVLQDRERLRMALDEEFRALSELCQEYGAWDLIWNFLDHPTAKFVTYDFRESPDAPSSRDPRTEYPDEPGHERGLGSSHGPLRG